LLESAALEIQLRLMLYGLLPLPEPRSWRIAGAWSPWISLSRICAPLPLKIPSPNVPRASISDRVIDVPGSSQRSTIACWNAGGADALTLRRSEPPSTLIGSTLAAA
jgi:hypothetical protein